MASIFDDSDSEGGVTSEVVDLIIIIIIFFGFYLNKLSGYISFI